MKKLLIELSKRGIPCLWERGGGFTNTGNCELICDMNGHPKKPIYIRKSGTLACDSHALIPIRVNDYFIEFYHHRKNFGITILKIISFNIDSEEKNAYVEQVNHFCEGKWEYEIEEKFNKVIEAGKKKCLDYHCKKPYFIKKEI